MDIASCRLVTSTFDAFLSDWKENSPRCILTTPEEDRRERMWLFRLASGERNAASAFTKALNQRIGATSTPGLKRQTNLPTPVFEEPAGERVKIDIGLHPVNDEWNGTLMMFLYYEGRNYNPPHLQYGEFNKYDSLARHLWTSHVCDCHRGKDHCAHGCYECFMIDCPKCRGTGWRRYSDWEQNGFRINYSKKYPIAVL